MNAFSITAKGKETFSKILLFSLVAIGGCLLARGIVFSDEKILAIFAFTAIAIVVWQSTVNGIYLLLLFLFLINYLVTSLAIFPYETIWLQDVIILLLFMKGIGYAIKEKRLKGTPIDIVLVLLVITYIFSAFGNNSSIIGLTVAIRRPLKYILLFYALIYLDLNEVNFKKIFRILIVIAFLQIPIVLFQHYIYDTNIGYYLARFGGAWGKVDFCTGSVGRGGTSTLAFLLISFFLIFLGSRVLENRSKEFPLLPAFLLLIPLPFALSIGANYLFPLAGAFVLFFYRFPKKIIIKGVLLVMLAAIFLLIIKTSIRTDIMTDIRGRIVGEQTYALTGGRQTGRLGSLRATYQAINEDPFSFLLGKGPGRLTVSHFVEHKGALFNPRFPFISHLQVTNIAGEVGVLGLAFFYIMIFRIFLFANNALKEFEDPYWRTISYGLMGIIVLFTLGSVYISPWFIDHLSFLFWFLLSGIFLEWRRVRAMRDNR